MKKFILGAAIVMVSTASFAQKTIKEGMITYKIEWMPPPAAQQMASRFPAELKVIFKNDSSVLSLNSSFFSNKFISNSKTEYLRLLVDVPMMNKKYSVIFTPDDMEQMQESNPEFETTATNETKTINGYKAEKYKVKEKKSGQTFDAWFTKEIAITPNVLTGYYDKSIGVPLDFQTVAMRTPAKATLTELKESPAPQGSFAGGKEYQEITMAELMSLMSGGRR